jgi:hypothetical protein
MFSLSTSSYEFGHDLDCSSWSGFSFAAAQPPGDDDGVNIARMFLVSTWQERAAAEQELMRRRIRITMGI